MHTINFAKFTATFDDAGVTLRHVNGGEVTISYRQLESWLLRMFRKLI
jgi:hypothetical protein